MADRSRAARWMGLAGLALGLCGPTMEAAAQTRTASRSCQQQCLSQPLARSTPRNMQVCLVRCTAGEAHVERQRRGGAAAASGLGIASRNTPIGRQRPSLVIYTGALPQSGIAISHPAARGVAHRAAETNCFSRNGGRPCSLLIETEQRCVAVARSIRARGLVITRDPATFAVLHYGAGGGNTQAAAREVAMQDCTSRLLPGDACRPMVARCGPPG